MSTTFSAGPVARACRAAIGRGFATRQAQNHKRAAYSIKQVIFALFYDQVGGGREVTLARDKVVLRGMRFCRGGRATGRQGRSATGGP